MWLTGHMMCARAGGLRSQDWRAQLAALRESLLASQAEWKIVIGHHPPRTNGHHNNTVELMQHLEPVLQVCGALFSLEGHARPMQPYTGACCGSQGAACS